MPRYHFNVHDGRSDLDASGTKLPNMRAARVEALRLAGRIIQDEAGQVGFGDDWRVEVTDDAGMMLFRMDIVIAEAPAAKGAALLC